LDPERLSVYIQPPSFDPAIWSCRRTAKRSGFCRSKLLSADVAGSSEDDISILWLKNSSTTDADVNTLEANAGFVDLFAATEKDKQMVVVDTGHDVSVQWADFVRVVLNWLDHYLGRVK
jgi:hypothetical protein